MSLHGLDLPSQRSSHRRTSCHWTPSSKNTWKHCHHSLREFIGEFVNFETGCLFHESNDTKSSYTPQKFNMEPERIRVSKIGISFCQGLIFRWTMLNCGGVQNKSHKKKFAFASFWLVHCCFKQFIENKHLIAPSEDHCPSNNQIEIASHQHQYPHLNPIQCLDWDLVSHQPNKVSSSSIPPRRKTRIVDLKCWFKKKCGKAARTFWSFSFGNEKNMYIYISIHV